MLLLSFVSCLHVPISPKSYVHHYDVHIDASFQQLQNPKKSDQMVLDLVLRISPVERLKDDSVLYRVVVESEQAVVNEELLTLGIQGKWVETRAFEFGELLSIVHMEEWVAENSYMDALDIVWFLLYPNPPNVRTDQSRASLSRYPLQYAESQKSRVVLKNTWTLASIGKEAKLLYEGDMNIRGKWDDFRQSGKGHQKGELMMDVNGGNPLEHTGSLTRRLCYTGADTICQKQEFTFTMKRRP